MGNGISGDCVRGFVRDHVSSLNSAFDVTPKSGNSLRQLFTAAQQQEVGQEVEFAPFPVVQ
jgi:hypothetical protein